MSSFQSMLQSGAVSAFETRPERIPSSAEAVARHKRISRRKIPLTPHSSQRPGLKLLDDRLVQHWRIHTQQRIRQHDAVRLRVPGLRDGGVLRGARSRRRNPELGVGLLRVEPAVRRSGTPAHVCEHRLERHERRSAVQGARLRTGRHDPGPQSAAESVLHGHPRLRGAETRKPRAPSPQGVRVARVRDAALLTKDWIHASCGFSDALGTRRAKRI